MKKRVVTLLLATVFAMSAVTGCGQSAAESAVAEEKEVVEAEETAENEGATEEATDEAEDALSDEEAAKQCADLIDAIYVQERTDETDAQCEAAKKAWDALSDEAKEMVEGEDADPDYFGRDTGDAGLDDSRNGDEIGENEILVVSFGTSFNDSRAKDIKGIEDAISEAYPEYSVRRAFTAQIIINHVQARDSEKIDNMDQALERAINNGVKNLVVQPTHLMHGAEYDEMCEAIEKVADKFETVRISEPMLGQVGNDATEINADKENVAKAVVAATVESAGASDIKAMADDSTALVLMGHGTSHTAKVTYSQMQTQMNELGYDNVFIGTVEGEPEETACENVIEAVANAGYKNVILRPLMVVAGDHANNDMAGDDEDSWKSMFNASGKFDSVDTQIEGLGRIKEVQDIYVSHLADALDSEPMSIAATEGAAMDLADGEYEVSFNTDSSMFHVNDSCNGKAKLTVKDGVATAHLVLTSKNIANLYLGMADDAKNDEANLINPTVEEVTYDDGSKEEVNAFDVVVPAIDEEFDLALIGTKGKWYDHKVSVSDVVIEN